MVRKTVIDASRPGPSIRSVAVAIAAMAALLCLAASNAGCIVSHQHVAQDVTVEVLDRLTEQRLSEWVVESVLQSESAWLGSDITFETTLRLVMANRPGENKYHVDAFTECTSILLNLFQAIYHDSRDEGHRVYAVGYEIGDEMSAGGPRRSHKGGSGPAEPVVDVRYKLSPWNNDRANPAVLEVLSMLENKDNFHPYEALRGKPQGTGVPIVYRYYIERYKAIMAADPDLRIKPSVKETVAWLEQAVAGTVAPSPWASPTTIRRSPACTTGEWIFRVVARESMTMKHLDSWVTVVDRLATSRGAQSSAGEAVLVVDSRTADSPDTRVPPFIIAERIQEMEICFGPNVTVTVYAFGYEPATVTPFRSNVNPVGPFDAPLCVPGCMVIECHLHKWNSNNARAFGKLLEDDGGFAQYERLRRQGSSGVLDLYRYFLGRYDALDAARQQELSEKARQRVTWIRQQVK